MNYDDKKEIENIINKYGAFEENAISDEELKEELKENSKGVNSNE